MKEVEYKYYSSWMLNEFRKRGHPLAKGIDLDETNQLIDNLIKRLSLSEAELDLSPKSLKILEKSMKQYYQREIKDIRKVPEEKILEIIREISAYIGKTIIINTDGEWVNRGTLQGTEIKIPGPIQVTKGNRKRISDRTKVSISNIATVFWDNMVIEYDYPDFLYKDFKSIQKKKFRGI